ncbi:SGNH hydrolase [Arthrobacter sp. MYb211]|uniref:SGNH/GDSL hydrolase family protein n=1 Tax=Micrococcaceae TaxID=1268 RepID=UPI000CFB555F|nr:MULTISPECIES: SGNH/GDSL hydrolase family protein [unclassified Arthrobacter]PQZ98171.1 SGNH hydrolase [Arthrobacter sp. MYb224]PRA02423.1 SGNH hydrolase [Arthrobacter sp. MYb229]PRA13388.1 SGNH hydrolase [Arthrobacter sp. MYb221]PRB50634.1 SGNH hydrolase [Arthrobacter sp. MYb216]PRC10585.1 SGNH hydrolase [Arthrobacter sp. MYb211]
MSENSASESSLPAHETSHPWRRYVALGDSFTEGIGDPDPQNPGRHRGWADRLAQQLSTTVPDFSYANLAIRGRLIGQIISEQVTPAINLKPDLISICAGGNDVIRPGGDPDRIAEQLERAISDLSKTGATILLLTGPDIRDTPVLGGIRGKVAIYNENVRAIAQRYDAVVGDLWALNELRRTRMWDPDRLHFSPLGHQLIAAMALDALNVPHELSLNAQLDNAPRSWREARIEDLQWAREYFAPWVLRRIRHQSSGDGVTAKRPVPTPFTLPPPNESLGAGDSAPMQD